MYFFSVCMVIAAKLLEIESHEEDTHILTLAYNLLDKSKAKFIILQKQSIFILLSIAVAFKLNICKILKKVNL